MNAQVKEVFPALPATFTVLPISPELLADAQAKLDFARANFKVLSAEHYAIVADGLKTLKGGFNRVETERKERVAPINLAKDSVQRAYTPVLDLYKQAEDILKRALNAFDAEQERIRQEQQRAAEQEAARQRAKLEERAAKAEASGKADKADDLRAAASMVVAPVVQVEAPKVSGLKKTKVWKYKVVDESKVSRTYLMLDEKKIAKVVKALGAEAASAIGGIEVYEETQLASGSR